MGHRCITTCGDMVSIQVPLMSPNKGSDGHSLLIAPSLRMTAECKGAEVMVSYKENQEE